MTTSNQAAVDAALKRVYAGGQVNALWRKAAEITDGGQAARNEIITAVIGAAAPHLASQSPPQSALKDRDWLEAAIRQQTGASRPSVVAILGAADTYAARCSAHAAADERERIATWLDAMAEATSEASVKLSSRDPLMETIAPFVAASLRATLTGVAGLIRNPPEAVTHDHDV